MDQNYPQKQQPFNEQYSGQPPYPTQYTAAAPSAPMEFTNPQQPPPQYSVVDPSYPQQTHAPYTQTVPIQQQPQVQHIIVHQIPR